MALETKVLDVTRTLLIQAPPARVIGDVVKLSVAREDVVVLRS